MNNKSKAALITIGAFCVLTALVPITLYAYKIGYPTEFSLSKSANEWAQFGDFIGGTLGTTFAGVTVLLLIATLYFQSKEITDYKNALENEKKKDERNEILKLINWQVERLEKVLNTKVEELPYSLGFSKNEALCTIKTQILLYNGLNKTPEGLTQIEEREKLASATRISSSMILIELKPLRKLLGLYKKIGHKDITEFYIRRYSHLIKCMVEDKFIEKDSLLAKMFEEKEIPQK